MVSIQSYINRNIIKESIDTENLFWKLDIWFNKNSSEQEKELFKSFIDICRKNNRVNKNDVSDYISKVDIKPFIKFITDNVSGIEISDYTYILTKITELILANKTYELNF